VSWILIEAQNHFETKSNCSMLQIYKHNGSWAQSKAQNQIILFIAFATKLGMELESTT
jgi:hypothetical protein